MSNYDDQLSAMDKPMDRAEHMRNRPRQLDDSERNQLAELAGEADEPCYFCDEPVRPSMRGGLSNIEYYWEFTADRDGELPCHEECYDNAKEAAEERRAEERAEDRLNQPPPIGWGR